MSFVEIIGFIISLLALIYLFFKQQSLARYRQEHPEAFKDEELIEDDPLTEFMKEIEKEAAAREAARRLPPPPPPPKIIQKSKQVTQSKQSKKTKQNQQFEHIPVSSPLGDYRLTSQIEKRKIKSSLENYHIKSPISQRFEENALPTIAPSHHPNGERGIQNSRAEAAFRRLTYRRDLIIYQEIIDKPKSLRPNL